MTAKIMTAKIITAIMEGNEAELINLLAEAPKGTKIRLTDSMDEYLYEKKAKTWNYARWNYGQLTCSMGNQRPLTVAKGCMNVWGSVEVR